MRTVSAILVVSGLLVAPAVAQTVPADTENGRYAFQQVADGALRLDTRTGQVSFCTKRPTGWACESVPDERAALENEITRLQRENGALKKDMLARGLPLPESVARLPAPGRERELNLRVPLPSDAEIDRMVTTVEKLWRRLMEMVQKDQEKKS